MTTQTPADRRAFTTIAKTHGAKIYHQEADFATYQFPTGEAVDDFLDAVRIPWMNQFTSYDDGLLTVHFDRPDMDAGRKAVYCPRCQSFV